MTIEECFPNPQEAEEVRAIFASIEFSDAYEYMDNYRFAVVDNQEQEREYYRRQSNGCCGYYDNTHTLSTGKVVRIGFNYGH